MKESRGPARLLRDLDVHIAIVMLLTLVFVTVLGVYQRYWRNDPLTWLEEVQLACFVWIIFLGACAVARTTGHIAIDAFVGLFPAGLRKATKTITHLIIIACMGFFDVNAWRYVWQMYSSERLTNILSIPYWLIYGVVPVACLYLVINSFLVLFGVIDPKPVNYVKEAGNV